MPDSNLLHLDPDLFKIYRQWITQCHAAGLAVKVIVTWRSAADQNAVKANNLSNASAGQSPHNCCDAEGDPCSRAFDFAVFDKNAAYIKDGADPRYRHAGVIGERLGLVWGGRWKHPDYDHLEMKNWKTLNSAD